MAKRDSNITGEGKLTRVSSKYTKDFKSKVKSLQASFTGKNRRKLYDTLLAKSVITENYTVEMWNNDFKAWNKNPNNGIFRYLEMVSAILDEANIPAFEVFGGPHARDTDEIIKSISSRIENYLENSLREFKDYITKNKRTIQKRERTINGNAFKNMEKVRELILENRYFQLHQYCPDIYNSAFFFLYAWTDLEKKLNKPESEELVYSIEKLAEKIMNTTFAPYYYGYFSEPYDNKQCNKKYFKFRASAPPRPIDFFFDNILNQALLISYQLSCIIHTFSLYYDHKEVSYTVNYPDNPSYPLNIDEIQYLDIMPKDITIPMRLISNIKERVHILLRIGTFNNEVDNEHLKKIFRQKLQEIKEIFLSIVILLTNNEMNSDNISYLINRNEKQNDLSIDIPSYLNNIIENFLNIMEYLDLSNPNHIRENISLLYTIDKKNKREQNKENEKEQREQKDEINKVPIQIRKDRLFLILTQDILDNLDIIINQFKTIYSVITRCDESTDTARSISGNSIPEQNVPPSEISTIDSEQNRIENINFNKMKIKGPDGKIITPHFISRQEK